MISQVLAKLFSLHIRPLRLGSFYSSLLERERGDVSFESEKYKRCLLLSDEFVADDRKKAIKLKNDLRLYVVWQANRLTSYRWN